MLVVLGLQGLTVHNTIPNTSDESGIPDNLSYCEHILSAMIHTFTTDVGVMICKLYERKTKRRRRKTECVPKFTREQRAVTQAVRVNRLDFALREQRLSTETKVHFHPHSVAPGTDTSRDYRLRSCYSLVKFAL